MKLLERVKCWLHIPQSFESIATELAEGLENGTIIHVPATEDENEQPITSSVDLSTSPASTNDVVGQSREVQSPHESVSETARSFVE